jgi:hypothetical protein
VLEIVNGSVEKRLDLLKDVLLGERQATMWVLPVAISRHGAAHKAH